MKKNNLEAVIGLLVIVITITFFFFAKNTSDSGSDKNTYSIDAKFSKIDGINIGSDVTIAGIKIGVVSAEKLDLGSYEAVLSLAIKPDVKIPTDSIASIVSSGFLGKKYVAIEPGAEEEFIAPNGKIIYTQASVNLETLIGKFIFKDQNAK